jgi:dTDP-4-dehydrorhamnose reductase
MQLSDEQTVLITGANSKTSEALARVFQASGRKNVIYTSSHPERVRLPALSPVLALDITNRKEVKDLCLRIQPNVIVNTAAFTNVDACETDKHTAWTVNVTAVEHLVQACRMTDAHLIHFSTDYVFDGEHGPYTEENTPNPLGYYGKTKLASENVCLMSSIDYTIVRTNVLYGATQTLKPDFAMWVLRKLAECKPFSVVKDQYSNPTLIDDLAYLVEKILQTRAKGIFHSGSPDWLNRYEFARKIAEVFKFDNRYISAVETADLRQIAARPLRGGLVSLKAETMFGMKFSTVEHGLLTMRRQLQLMGHRQWAL